MSKCWQSFVKSFFLSPAPLGQKTSERIYFVLTMVDDCSDAEQQKNFIKGMEDFTALCKKTTGKALVDCTTEERKKITEAIVASGEQQPELLQFLDTVKRRTIQAYTTSEFFLTKIQVYELVPGRYHGCVPV